MFSNIGWFFKALNEPDRRVSGFLLRSKLMKEFIAGSFICFGNLSGFFNISW